LKSGAKEQVYAGDGTHTHTIGFSVFLFRCLLVLKPKRTPGKLE